MSRRRISGGRPWRAMRRDPYRRARLWILFGAVLLLLVALFFVAALDTPSGGIERTGTVTGWTRVRPDGPTRPKNTVLLDNGVTVEVAGPNLMVLPTGSRVVILEQTTRLLGRKTYQFVGWTGVNEPPRGR